MARRVSRAPRRGRRTGIGGLLRRLVVLAVFLALGTAGWLAYFGMSALPGAPDTAFVIESGDSLSGAARKLAAQGVIDQAWSFSTLGRVFGMAGRIKAGSYQVGDAKSHYGLLRKITEGAVSLDKITIVEGWTFAQMRAALDNHPALRHDTAGMDAATLLARVGGAEGDAEGRFYPDTYYFDRGASDLDVYRRAHALMRDTLARAWAARAADLPYATPGEALIMASIVEKETGAADERPLIASVFVNRLRLGMRLQTDPTVIYGLGADFDGNLRKDDLLRDTPYNTYTRAGLPPGPIALPSGAALLAAVRPETSRMLYFVAKGGGRHQFSETLEDHNRAVSRYQRGGR
jgi:UPF0755 protein